MVTPDLKEAGLQRSVLTNSEWRVVSERNLRHIDVLVEEKSCGTVSGTTGLKIDPFRVNVPEDI